MHDQHKVRTCGVNTPSEQHSQASESIAVLRVGNAAVAVAVVEVTEEGEYWFCVLRLAPSCRAKDAINEHLGTNNVTTMQLDVAQFDTIRKFVDEFLAKEEPLHILINNAGVHLPGGWSDSPEESGQRTPEGFEVCAACNVPTWNLVVVQAAVLQSQSSAASSTAVPGCSVLCGRPATLPSPSSSSYLKLTSAAAMCR